MRPGPPDDLLAQWTSWTCHVQSWLGASLLADEVPVSRGRIVASVSQDTQERLTLTVPRWDGRDWLPGDDPSHPLARFGQELQVTIRVGSPAAGETWDVRVGRFLVTDWEEDGGVVQVTGDGLLRRVADGKLTSPSSPPSGSTLKSEARRLLPAGVSAGFDDDLVDRACPRGMAWSSDRLEALREIADAWPARLRTDEWGQVRFSRPLPDVPVPVLTLQEGPSGTVVSAPRSDTRDGSYNEVVARSSASASNDVQAVARLTSGPMAARPPYGTVTREWSSPLLGSRDQAQAAAETMLRTAVRPTRVRTATHVPDPRITLDDPVEVRTGELVERAGVLVPADREWGYVVGYDLPLTVADGAMRTDVGVAS